MYSYKEFKNLIGLKNILYIPIISCINRDTQEYNLSCDGNVNRFITTFSKCSNFSLLNIILPKIHIKDSEYIINKFVRNNSDMHHSIKIYYNNYFGIHAGEQRNKAEVVDNMLLNISDKYLDNYKIDEKINIIIFESQLLGKKLIEKYGNKYTYIWWNPVSKTNNKTRDFLEGYDKINEWLVKNIDYMIIASPDQCNYYKKYENKIFYLDELIDRKLSIFSTYNHNNTIETILDLISVNNKIFYLPYRLTDKGYNIDLVLEYLYNELSIAKSKNKSIRILYADPNNSHYIDNIIINNELKDLFIKVSSDRNTYYTILDYKKGVIIPYFEDIEFINHASINEFKNSNATILLYKQYNNPYNINQFNNFINLK